MSTIIESYSTEGKVLKSLNQNYRILGSRILVSKYPILALVEDDANFLLVECLTDGNRDYIDAHLAWFYTNLKSLKIRFHISPLKEEKILFITLQPMTIELQLPSLNSDVGFFLYTQGELSPFADYVINLDLCREFLWEITSKKLRRKAQILLENITGSPPVVCKRKGRNYLQISTEDGSHNFYFLTTKILYHKGPAPFSPIVIS